jgi:hypothetical protein
LERATQRAGSRRLQARTVRTGSGGTHVYVAYPAGSQGRIKGGANFAGLHLATSNFDVPIYARGDDRRWFVVRTATERRPESYYADLFGNGLVEVAAFKGWLLRRDLSGFNAGGKAPMTAGKLELIAGSRTPLADEIARMTEERNILFTVMTLSEIITVLVARDVVERGKISDRQVIDALRAVGWCRREGQVWIDGKSQRV